MTAGSAMAQDVSDMGVVPEVADESEEEIELVLEWNDAEDLKLLQTHLDLVQDLAKKTIFSNVSWGLGDRLKGTFANLAAARKTIAKTLTAVEKVPATQINEKEMNKLVWNIGYDASAAKGRLAALATRELGQVDVDMIQELDEALDELVNLGKMTAQGT